MATDIKISKDDTEVKSAYQYAIESSPTLIAEYHQDTIKQSDLIVKNAVFMIWAGILLIIASFAVYAAGLTQTLAVGTVAGSFIDIFSATILYLFNKTDKDKQVYFNNLSKMENDRRFMELIQNTKDEEFRKKMIQKMFDKA